MIILVMTLQTLKPGDRSSMIGYLNSFMECNGPQVLSILYNYPTTKKMWEHLESSFSAKESLSHNYSVIGSYFKCKQGDSYLTGYYTKLSKLLEELRVIFSITFDIKV